METGSNQKPLTNSRGLIRFKYELKLMSDFRWTECNFFNRSWGDKLGYLKLENHSSYVSNMHPYCLYLWFWKVRVSAILSNAPYLLNVDCDHYINNSKALREAMCFMMDPASGKHVCYVQFPQRFDGIDRHDRYSNRNVVFFDVRKK